MKKCKHKFHLIHGGSWGGLLSYHGRCEKCDKEMERIGRVDEKGNGTIQERTLDNEHTKLYLVKGHKVVGCKK